MELQRLGISEITTRNWTLEEDVGAYANYGVAHIGVWSFKCEGMNPKFIRETVSAHGLQVSNVCFGGLFTGDTAAERLQAMEETKRLIDLTQSIDGHTLLLVSGPIHSHSLSHAVDLVRRGLDEVVAYAEQCQVHLGLEALHPLELTQWSVVNTLPLSLRLADEFASPYLGVFLDTYNNGWDPNLLDLIPVCRGRIKGVHLADWRNPTRSFTDRTMPGKGVLPIRDIVQKIEATGYTGTYDLELFSDEVWEADYHDVIRTFQDWFRDLDGTPSANSDVHPRLNVNAHGEATS